MTTMRLAALSFLLIALTMKPLLITCKDVNNAVVRNEIARGIPVSFSPKLNSSGVVHESANLLIRFHVFDDDKSNQWRVNKKADKNGDYLLSAGVKAVKDDWFQIVKSGKRTSYKIMYCPGQSCKPVSLTDGSRLAVNDHVAVEVSFRLRKKTKNNI
ncbi:hypothetical protein ACFE04_005763 [Oxalis oulophora]